MTRSGITAQQADVLAHLYDHGACTLQQLREHTGLCRSQINALQLAMRNLALITIEPGHKAKKPFYLVNTMVGARALGAYQDEQEAKAVVKVPPAAFNTKGTEYKPTTQAYYRNSGNRHIASAGVRC